MTFEGKFEPTLAFQLIVSNRTAVDTFSTVFYQLKPVQTCCVKDGPNSMKCFHNVNFHHFSNREVLLFKFGFT